MASDAVSFEAVAWDERANDDLAMIQDAPGHLADWKQAVKRDEAQLWAVIEADERIGSVVWEVEHTPNGPVAHIMAVAARARGADVSATVLRAFTALAKAARLVGVRAETRRRGLVRKMGRAGCAVAQIGPGLFGIEVENGQ